VTLVRLAVEPKVTADQMAAWGAEQILVTVRRLHDSDDFLAPEDDADVWNAL